MALLLWFVGLQVQRHRHHSAEWLRDLSVCRSQGAFEITDLNTASTGGDLD